MNPDLPVSPAAARRRGKAGRYVLAAFLAAWLIAAFYNLGKPLPAGLHSTGPLLRINAADVDFLYDLTIQSQLGERILRQEIFDRVFGVIDHAESILVLDFFLFNSYAGALPFGRNAMRPLAATLAAHLLARKKQHPGLVIVLVTDPINEFYGAERSADFIALERAGVVVARTDLDRLRDSNAIYSGFWRIAVRWWADRLATPAVLPNPLDDGPSRVSLNAWLKMLNFKANHRKLIAGDDGQGGWVSIIGSANPHDASSAHSNVALRIRGPLARSIFASEIAIARWSTGDDRLPAVPELSTHAWGSIDCRLLTEGAIKSSILSAIGGTAHGDEIGIAMFYLADRDIVAALAAARAQGADLRIVLDPNRDAFGRRKNGIPNRPVAAELARHGVAIRWYRTHGEQFHSKLAYVRHGAEFWLNLGSANYTRRNLDDYNLEANVELRMRADSPTAVAVRNYFDMIWAARDAAGGALFTADYREFADDSRWLYWRYRLMEATGLGLF